MLIQILALIGLILVLSEGTCALWDGNYGRVFGCLIIGASLAFNVGGLLI